MGLQLEERVVPDSTAVVVVVTQNGMTQSKSESNIVVTPGMILQEILEPFFVAKTN